jgi:two-component sensor histidine kinase
MDNGRLKLVWQESGGPPVKSPKREGFGTTLISRAFEHEDGGAQIEFEPQGVICTMRFAL